MEQKRKRAPNYTIREKEVLLQLVSKHKNIIENKKTDAVTVSEKNQAWCKITEEFNSLCPNNVFRSTESLKKYYENLKEDLRKRAGEERRSIYKTGGGPVSPKRIPEDDLLLGIINKKSIFGLKNHFDSDNLEEFIPNVGSENKEKATKTDNDTNTNVSIEKNMEDFHSSSPVIELVFENEQENNGNTIDMLFSNPSGSCGQFKDHGSENNNWAKTKPGHLRKPLSSPLKQNIIMVNEDKSCTKDGVIEHKSCTKDGAAKLRKTVKTRRRPSTVRVLTSSSLAEKYSLLIEKKLELAECLKKEHLMRMKILNFDIELKKKELKSIGCTDMDIQLMDSCESNL